MSRCEISGKFTRGNGSKRCEFMISELSILLLVAGDNTSGDCGDEGSEVGELSKSPRPLTEFKVLFSRLYDLRILLTASSDPLWRFFACLRSKSLLENGR